MQAPSCVGGSSNRAFPTCCYYCSVIAVNIVVLITVTECGIVVFCSVEIAWFNSCLHFHVLLVIRPGLHSSAVNKTCLDPIKDK